MTVGESYDLADLEDLLSRHYAVMRLRSTDGGGASLERRPVGAAVLGRVTYAMSVDAASDPLDAICVQRARSGVATYRVGREEHDMAGGDLALVALPHEPFEARIDHLDLDHVLLPTSALDAVAQNGPREPGPVRLLGRRPVGAVAAARFRRVYALVHDLAGRAEVGGDGLVAAEAGRLLAAAVLETFPNTAVTEPGAGDRHDAHPDTLRRAIAFIDSRPDDAISVADVAAAAFVTPRAVQLAFARHLDTTPMRYLQSVRLDRAHRDLVAADPQRTTVTDVAMRWGFGSPSRFAITYRAVHGVPPSHTLRERG